MDTRLTRVAASFLAAAATAAWATDPPAVPGAHSSAPLPAVVCPTQAQCAAVGGFTPTFVEPVIYDRSDENDQQGGIPIKNPLAATPSPENCTLDAQGLPLACKPAGASIANMPDGRVLFFNALEGTENIEFSIVIEGGSDIINDQTRVLTLDHGNALATWTLPGPVDAGADDSAECLLPGCLLNTKSTVPHNSSGALFCADLANLYDGRVIAVGGTNYYSEPGVTLSLNDSPFDLGVAELEGLKSSRIYDERTNEWAQTGDMNYGRWYPSLVTMPDGDLFVASGVTKLVKPVYPAAPFQSGRNVVQTETFKLGCGIWSDNGGPAQRSLPLFPRLHLLPNGQVFYDGVGQAFNPFGESYDQPLWNIVGAYDPATATWTDLGYAGLPLQLNQMGVGQIVSALNPTNPLIAKALAATLDGLLNTTLDDPQGQLQQILSLLKIGGGNAGDTLAAVLGSGMRGSTFSIMMPLQSDAAGNYTHADFLVSGGVITAVALTNPGSYFATQSSRMDSVDLSGGSMAYSSRLTGRLNQPRWYGTGTLLPTGEVVVFSGADRDEVVLPGTGKPVMQGEIYNPATDSWSPVASQDHARTYHNTAMLLQDGTVLVGGHAPIDPLPTPSTSRCPACRRPFPRPIVRDLLPARTCSSRGRRSPPPPPPWRPAAALIWA